MYCNKCGKELPEGSRFCLYCGTELGKTPKPDNKVVEYLQGIFGRVGLNIYALWFLANFTLLILGGQGTLRYWGNTYMGGSSASGVLVPFTAEYEHYLAYYDKTEFILYVIIVPAFILVIKNIVKKKK